MDDSPQDPLPPSRKENGWQRLRRQEANSYQGNFGRILTTMRRNDLMASIIDLLFNAMPGAVRIGLGARSREHGAADTPDSQEPTA